MMTKALVVVALCVTPLAAQEITLVPGVTRDFRGLAARGQEMWAAGRGGAYARSTDGGHSWKAGKIPGAEDLVLVDVEALGRDTACVVATSFDSGLGRAYRTTDGGEHWALAYELKDPQVFLDGMAFWDPNHGIAFGDPVNGGFFVLRTSDGCASWKAVPASSLPTPLEGEAGFAASGTAIAVAGDGHAWIGTGGGSVARVLHTSDRGTTWTATPTPMPAGPATGIFGVAFLDTLTGIAVGGNYQQPSGDAPTVLATSDGGLTWVLTGPAAPPGVRFGAAALPQAGAFVASGPSGVGVSLDVGKTWMPVDTLPSYGLLARDREAWIGGTTGWIAHFDLDQVLRKHPKLDR
jgi:photosystem II stability/assembly factor-like uncharacterized protein